MALIVLEEAPPIQLLLAYLGIETLMHLPERLLDAPDDISGANV